MRFHRLGVVVALCLASGSLAFRGLTMCKRAAPAEPKPFALVELFTSEGCSSCPLADELLSKLAAEARKDGKPVYFLAYHVDYWNRLGWADPFSAKEHTDRQNRYAAALKLPSIYTPQLIISGGPAEFVGSDEARARREIRSALAAPATAAAAAAAVTLKSVKRDGRNVTADYALTGTAVGDELHVVVVERGLATAVPRGENAGKKLHHDNVVRASNTVTITAKPAANLTGGSATLILPEGCKPENVDVIAFLQSPATMKISAATAAPLETLK